MTNQRRKGKGRRIKHLCASCGSGPRVIRADGVIYATHRLQIVSGKLVSSHLAPAGGGGRRRAAAAFPDSMFCGALLCMQVFSCTPCIFGTYSIILRMYSFSFNLTLGPDVADVYVQRAHA